MTSGSSQICFATFEALNEAELFSTRSGLIGAKSERLYRVLSSIDANEQSPIVWMRLIQSAKETRNLAVAVRALYEKAMQAGDGENSSLQWLILGHFMRFVAQDSSESAVAYVNAYSDNWADALCATLALHRLRRSEPQCDEVSAAISALKQKCPIKLDSRAKIEARIRNIPNDEPNSRAQALIDLALNAILEGGDASHALDWLCTAQSLNENIPNALEIMSAILLAVPDNAPIIRNITEKLIEKKAWKYLDLFARVAEPLPFGVSDECLIQFSMMYALEFNDEQRASFYFYRCAMQSPRFCSDAIQNQSWICLYAATHSQFRIAVWEGIKLIGNDGVLEAFLTHMGRFASTPEIRIHAQTILMRHYIHTGNDPKALKLLTRGIKSIPERKSFWFYDILACLVHSETSPQDTAFNAQILQAADILCHKTHSESVYRRFLYYFLDQILSTRSASVTDSVLVQGIQKRLSSGEGIDVAYNASSITPENTPILASCIELIRNGQIAQAMQIFFEWFDTGAEFSSSLAILANLNAEITHQSVWDVSVIQAVIDPQASLVFDELQPDNAGLNPQSATGILALALVLEPQTENWLDRLKRFEAHWDIVTETLLRYLPYVLVGDALCSIITQTCLGRLSDEKARGILSEYLATCIQFDVLFKQVIGMSENNSQQNQLLEKMDEAIAKFSGDIVQKNALYAKKYKTAEMLGDESVKMTCLRDILETTPNDSFALEELSKVKPENLKPHSQILYYQLRIDTETTPSIKLENQMSLAALYAQSSQINNAITLYHTVIDEHPEFLEARYRLLDLLESLENWKSAENVLLALINAETSPQNRYQSFVRLAVIQNDRMMMPSRALLTLFAALDIDPSKLNALHSRLCEISERLHSFSPLLDKYEDFAMHSGEYSVRRTATLLLANVYAEHINKVALACNVLDEFYRSSGSSDPEFLQQLSAFYSNIQNWKSFIQVQNDLLACTTDNAERVKLALSAAHISESNLNDVSGAARFAKIASEANPATSQAWIEVADYFVAAGMSENAIDPLRNAAELEPNTKQKVLILLETTQILIELDKFKDAASLFHSLVSFHPEVDKITPVAETLISLATLKLDSVAFNQICDDLVMCCPVEEQTPLLLQKALTLARVFNNPEEAGRILNGLSDRLNTLDIEQSIILIQLLTSIGQPELAMQMLENVLKIEGLTKEQRYICLSECLKNAIELNDTETVKTTAEAIVEIEPEDANANFQLVQFDYYAGRWDQAAQRIEKNLPHQERLSADNAMLAQYYYAEILHASENDEKAIHCLDNAIKLRPDFRPAVDLRLSILLERKKWAEALPDFNLLLTLSDDPEVQGAIHKRIAEIHHFYLNDPEKAVFEYEQALTLGGDVEDVPIRLLQLYQDLELWKKAAMTAQVLAMAQVNSSDAKCEYLLVLANILSLHLDQPKEAIQTYLEAFLMEPFNVEIIKMLLRLLIQQKQWDCVDVILERLCKELEGNPKAAVNCIGRVACSVWAFEPCQNAIKKTDKVLADNAIPIRLVEFAQKHALCPESFASNSSKKRINIPSRDELEIVSDNTESRVPENRDSKINDGESEPVDIRTTDSVRAETIPVEVKPETKRSEQIQSIKSNVKTEQNLENTKVEKVAEVKKVAPSQPTKDINGVPSLSKPKTTLGLPEVRTSSLFSAIPSKASSKIGALKTIENLTFEVEDLQMIGSDAPAFTQKCLDDLYDIANVSHDDHPAASLPDTLSDLTRKTLVAPPNGPLNPGYVKLLSALAVHENSPLMFASGEPLHSPEISHEFVETFDKLCGLLKMSHVELKARPIHLDPNLPILNTNPVAVLCDPLQLSNMTQNQWIARMAFALVLSQPENILCACKPLSDLQNDLTDASTSMNSIRANASTVPKERLETFKKVLMSVGLNSSTMPRITQATLSLLKQHSVFERRIAIQAALILSQNLMECLQILSELENMRLPTSLLTLKSAMKRSQPLKDLILFALSLNAQKLYDRVFK